jgi:hypothetical protein
MSMIFYPEIVGNPFFQSVKNELLKRRGLSQTAYNLEEGDSINTLLWQPYFKMTRVNETNVYKNDFDYYSFNSNDIIKGKFSSIGKVSEEDVYKIEQGALDAIDKYGGKSDFKIDPGITSVSIKQDNFTFFTATVNFTVPDISDWKAFRDMWLMWGFPVELEFGRYTNVTLNYTNGDVNPQVQRLRGIIANFNYRAGDRGRSISGEIKVYSPSHLFPLMSKNGTEIQKDQFQGHIMDRIKGDRYLWGQSNEIPKYGKSTKEKQREDSPFIEKPTSSSSEGKVVSSNPNQRGAYSPPDVNKNVAGDWRKDAAFLAEVERVSKKFDIHSNDLLNVIAFESGFNPSIKNKDSSATGLIQFTEGTAKGLGTSTAQIKQMSRAEQMTYVEKYFDKWKLPRGADRGTIYATVLYPAYAKRDPIITTADGSAYTGNKALDINNDGQISSVELGAKLDKTRRDFGINDNPITDKSGYLTDFKNRSFDDTDAPNFDEFNKFTKDPLKNPYGVDMNIPTAMDLYEKERARYDYSGQMPLKKTDSWLEGELKELVYIPINKTDVKHGNKERDLLTAVNSAKFSGKGDSKTHSREQTERIPISRVYTVVPSLNNINGVKGISELIPTIISYFRLNSQIFGTEWYYYISMYAIEQILNEFLMFLSDAEEKKEHMITRIDISDVEIRNLANLKINVGSVYPESVLFDPYKKSTFGKTKFASWTDENGNPTGEYYYENTKLRDVYISAQFLYDLTRDESINSAYMFIEAIVKKINDSTAGLIQLQKINKSIIDSDSSTVSSHIITYVDESIMVKNFDNSADNYYVFDLFNPNEKARNAQIQSELGDDYANFVYFQENAKYHLNANTTIDEKNPNNGGQGKEKELLPPVDVLSEYVKNFTLDGLTDTKLTNMQNNEEGAHRFKTIDYFNDTATRQIESILSKSGAFNMENITQEDYSPLTKFFATLHWVYEVYLTKLHVQIVLDNNSSIKLPLKYTFDIDGIAGLIQGQVFKINPESFPMGFSIADDINLYSFVLTNIDHEFVNNTWVTKLGSMLYLSQGARKKMMGDDTLETIENALTEIEERTTDAVIGLNPAFKPNETILGNDVESKIYTKSFIPKVTPADFKQFELKEQRVKKTNLLNKITESIKKVTNDISRGIVSAGIGASQLLTLVNQANKIKNELDQMKLITFEYEKNIFDLGTFVKNESDNNLSDINEPKELLNKKQNELNGIFNPIYDDVDENQEEINKAINDSTKLNEEISFLTNDLKTAMSVSTSTGIVSQNESIGQIQAGLDRIELLSKQLDTKLIESASDPKKLIDVSNISNDMVQTLETTKKTASMVGGTNVIVGHNGFQNVESQINKLSEKSVSISNITNDVNRVANPIQYMYQSENNNNELNLSTQVGVKQFKNSDLSAVPDGFANQLLNHNFLKGGSISYKRSKGFLKI